MGLLARSSHRLIPAVIWLIFSSTISCISSSAFKIIKPPGSLTFLFQVHPGLYSKLWYNPQSLNGSQTLSFPTWQAARKAMNIFFTVMHLVSDSSCCYYAASVSVWILKKRKNVQVLRGEQNPLIQHRLYLLVDYQLMLRAAGLPELQTRLESRKQDIYFNSDTYLSLHSSYTVRYLDIWQKRLAVHRFWKCC